MYKIETNKAPAAIGPYSQAMIGNSLLFTSGQIPLDPKTGTVVGTEIISQSEQVMQNLAAVLEAAGTSFDKVLKTTDFAAFNEVYAKYFVGKPARSCFAVKGLPKNVLVEVELIAEL